jgi:hypothetical protein
MTLSISIKHRCGERITLCVAFSYCYAECRGAFNLVHAPVLIPLFCVLITLPFKQFTPMEKIPPFFQLIWELKDKAQTEIFCVRFICHLSSLKIQVNFMFFPCLRVNLSSLGTRINQRSFTQKSTSPMTSCQCYKTFFFVTESPDKKARGLISAELFQIFLIVLRRLPLEKSRP